MSLVTKNIDGCARHHRDLQFMEDVGQRQPGWHPGRADDDVDILFIDKFSSITDRSRGVGCIVEDDVSDFLPVDFLGSERERSLKWDPQ